MNYVYINTICCTALHVYLNFMFTGSILYNGVAISIKMKECLYHQSHKENTLKIGGFITLHQPLRA